MNHIELLKKIRACNVAVPWARQYSTLKECWDNCERGDHLLWFAERIGIDHKILVLSSCDCAERALRFVAEGEDCPRIAIETAQKWANGVDGITIGDVKIAAAAVRAAARAAFDTTFVAVRAAARAAFDTAFAAAVRAAAGAAFAAAFAAASAAYDAAADAAASAAHAAAHAASAAAVRAAAGAAFAAAFDDELKWSANKVRERISWEMIEPLAIKFEKVNQ